MIYGIIGIALVSLFRLVYSALTMVCVCGQSPQMMVQCYADEQLLLILWPVALLVQLLCILPSVPSLP